MFPETRWSQLAAASLNGSEAGRAALEDFCRRYRGPVGGFLRWRGLDADEVEDLTQDFFLHFLRSESWKRADRLRGSFRSFLLGAVVHHIDKTRRRQMAQKRGGGAIAVALNEGGEPEEDGVLTESPSPDPAGAMHFDRAWAVAVLTAALERVAAIYSTAGKQPLYLALKPFLPGAGLPQPQEAVAAAFGLSVGAVKSEVFRLRQTFRDALRAEVATTVSAPHELEAELRHLQSVLLDPGFDWLPGVATPPG